MQNLDNAIFQLSGGILPNKEGYRSNPTLENQIHFLAIMIGADTVSLMEEGLRNKIRKIRELAVKRSECKKQSNELTNSMMFRIEFLSVDDQE